MNKKEKIKLAKTILTLIIIICISALIWYLVPGMKDILTEEGQIAFKERIQDLGFLGMLLLFGLQILQILLVVLPGEPFEVLAGMVYGAWGGALFITISVFITTIMIFSIVKKYGKKYLYNFFDKEKINKLEKKLLKNQNKLELILVIIFILPASPKSLVAYIGGLLPINKWRFVLISTFVRFPSVITSTMVGSNIMKGNFGVSVLIYAVSILITGIIILIVHKRDKKKEIVDIIQ